MVDIVDVASRPPQRTLRVAEGFDVISTSIFITYDLQLVLDKKRLKVNKVVEDHARGPADRTVTRGIQRFSSM